MAISKKLRYEILRRDNFTCRYCGAFAPIVVLEIDHVVPRSAGGSDRPGNLVAACHDCNSGKSDSPPLPQIVAGVEESARRWARESSGDPDEDDLREMYAYQESLYLLERLPAGRVLHYIAHAYAAALPYRPQHAELIRAAAGIASQDIAPAEVN